MNKKRLFILLSILLALLAISYLVLKPAIGNLSGYLSKSEQVKADILVVEGWIPYDALEQAYKEFIKGGYKYLVTTGVRYTPDYYKISDNGYLIFHTRGYLSGLGETGKHTIEILAYSDMGGPDRAHFNLFINDSLSGSFYADKSKKGYTIQWYGALKDIDSVMIQYDNDIYEPPQDRNLSVKEIRFDDRITIPYLYNSEYDMLKLDGKLRFRNNLTSSAQIARSVLISLGIDSTRVIAVGDKKTIINRTLSSAIAFRDWLSKDTLCKEINGINILTLGPHARRTWMTYSKILKGQYTIGIISLTDSGKQVSKIRRTLNTLRETLGIIYYWFILLPF